MGASEAFAGAEPGLSHPLPRSYRLKRRRLIRALFARNDPAVGSVAAGCVRLVFRMVPRDETGEDVPLQIGFSPGRGLKRAVDRNRVKRILREVYRKRQHVLIDLSLRKGHTLTMMALFRGRLEDAARCIPRDLPEAMQRLRTHAALASEPGSAPA